MTRATQIITSILSTLCMGSLYPNITIKIGTHLISKQALPTLQFILQKTLTIPHNEPVILRELRKDDHREITEVSKLILNNFDHRTEYKLLPQQVLDLYRQSNAPASLHEALSTPQTYAFVISKDSSLLGTIVARLQNNKSGSQEMVLRRLHTALNPAGYKGIGKALVTTCAFMAHNKGIPCMSAAATVPARSFLEHLGWHGSFIETPFKLKNVSTPILLKQFKCSYIIPEKLEGFSWHSTPNQ